MPPLLPIYRLALLLLLLILPGAAWAQPEPIRFGQPAPLDFTAGLLAADSAAEAVVLCDYGKATIVSDDDDRRQLRFDRITRIRILTKAGFDWAKVEVPLRHDTPGHTERLTNLQGTTYNLVNGAVVPTALPTTGIFTERVTDQYSLHKFALPAVREGSVIEYRYSIYSDYLHTLRDWQFQHSIPVRWSEFRAAMPHQFNYKIFLQSTQPLAVDEQSKPQDLTPHYRWAMRDVPALRPERYMTTPADYVNELSFELASYQGVDITSTWTQIDYAILHDWQLGAQLDQQGFLKADLARLPAPTASNARLRLAAVRALVTSAVKCTGEPRLHAAGPLRKIYQETHRGTVADVNLLFITALRAAGFTANPVLLSTRSHGRVRATLPQLRQFNYVAAHVQLADGEELVLDATDPLLPYDLLPPACLNQQGRLVAAPPGASRWVNITPRHRHTRLQRVQLQLTADGTLSGQLHEEHTGYAGAETREELLVLGHLPYARRVASQRSDWTISGFTITNRDSVQRPLTLDYAFRLPSERKGPLDAIYLSPLQHFNFIHNPFRAESRAYPVDFGMAQDETVVVNLTLPAGYELAELPKSKALSLPNEGGRFVYSVTATGPTVQLTSRVTLSKPVYAAAEYQSLREFYRLLLEKQGEKLVIKKKA